MKIIWCRDNIDYVILGVIDAIRAVGLANNDCFEVRNDGQYNKERKRDSRGLSEN